MTRILINLFT